MLVTLVFTSNSVSVDSRFTVTLFFATVAISQLLLPTPDPLKLGIRNKNFREEITRSTCCSCLLQRAAATPSEQLLDLLFIFTNPSSTDPPNQSISSAHQFALAGCKAAISKAMQIGLPALVNKNVGCPTKYDFQINNTYFLALSMSQVTHGTYLGKLFLSNNCILSYNLTWEYFRNYSNDFRSTDIRF